MTAFGQPGAQPEERDLVCWDGFDELDKKGAVAFYAGKHWLDVLAFLRDRRLLVGAHAYLEEWSVLTPPAIVYYARAYFEYLLETASSTEPNEEFIFYFLGRLLELFRAGSPFDAAQTDFIRRVVGWIGERAAEPGVFEYFGDDIRQDAEEMLAAMAARGS